MQTKAEFDESDRLIPMPFGIQGYLFIFRMKNRKHFINIHVQPLEVKTSLALVFLI